MRWFDDVMTRVWCDLVVFPCADLLFRAEKLKTARALKFQSSDARLWELLPAIAHAAARREEST